jgi:hypothetical protein
VSRETTEARRVVEHWEQQWARHVGDCSACGTSRLDNCGQGIAIKGQLAIARGHLRRSRELDRQPMDGQAGLW